jgi:outer membrane protein OmpA-like peptidoglycan-associated protein
MSHFTPLRMKHQPFQGTKRLVVQPCRPTRCRRSLATIAVASAIASAGCAAPLVAPTPPVCGPAAATNPADPVITATATSAEPAVILPGAVLALLRQLARSGDLCAIVLPPQGARRVLPLTPHRGREIEHGPARDRVMEKNLTAIATAVGELAASDSGLDTLRLLQTSPLRAPSHGPLIVITSGLSTLPPVDLRHLGWDLDADTVVSFLREQREIPDLTGRRVLLAGLGFAAGRQPQLRQGLRDRVVRLWTSVCRAGGASSCQIDSTEPDPVQPIAINVVPVIPLPRIPELSDGGPLPLPASALFPLDSARLGPDASELLRPLVARMLADDLAVSIRGCTDASTGTQAHNDRLSRDRAEAVAAALIRLGVREGRIDSVQGGGSCGASKRQEHNHPELIAKHRQVSLTFSTA